MRRAAAIFCFTPSLAALAGASSPAPAPTAPIVTRPNPNLTAEGIPGIPPELAARVARYQNFRAASLVDWHPTRRELLIATRFSDSAQLHRVAMPFGARAQLTFAAEPVAGGSYCRPAAGDCLIFSKSEGGNEQAQLYRLDFGGGEIVRLTDGKSKNEGILWNRKGDRFAFRSTARNGKDEDLWLMEPRAGASRKVFDATGSFSASDWSFDDARLAATEYISANESYLHVLDLATGAIRRLTAKDGTKVSYGDARFTRDGKSLITTSDRGSEFQHLARVEIATGRETPFGPAWPWDVEDFALSEDGRRLAVLVNEAGRTALHLLDPDTGKEFTPPKLPAGQISSLRWRPGAAELGFNLLGSHAPNDVYSLEVTTGKLTRWTASETGGLATDGFREPELVSFKSFDGRAIGAFVIPAAGKFAGPRPVLIDIHGGPEGQARPYFPGRWAFFSQELGVAIVEPNVRGSSGYGKSFLALDNGMKREDSVADIGALLDWIATRPDLDKTRVIVMGGSYGGYMTLASLTHFSTRLRGGIASVGISHFGTFLKNTSDYRRDLRRAEYGDERDPAMAAFFDKISPLNNAEKISVPLFVIQGKNDPRVPWTEAEQMVRKVRAGGQPVWYLLADDEGHGFAKKKNVDYQFLAQVLFVQEFLLK